MVNGQWSMVNGQCVIDSISCYSRIHYSLFTIHHSLFTIHHSPFTMKILSSIPLWLRNKYFLTGSVFLVWVLFFDDRDMMNNISHNRELKQLEQSRDYYQKQIEATQKELDLLKNDPAVLEKYAREKYMMKRDDEDLFIIKD